MVNKHAREMREFVSGTSAIAQAFANAKPLSEKVLGGAAYRSMRLFEEDSPMGKLM
jgi:hypothetical protein